MIDREKLRDKFMSTRDAVQARIDETQGDERRETAEGETDNAHLWEEADIRDASLDQATRTLGAIDGALQRLDDGTYGVCEVCGKTIPDGRLEVMPLAVTCVGCA
jgi:RNA polymerase-binding protein DksA